MPTRINIDVDAVFLVLTPELRYRMLLVGVRNELSSVCALLVDVQNREVNLRIQARTRVGVEFTEADWREHKG